MLHDITIRITTTIYKWLPLLKRVSMPNLKVINPYMLVVHSRIFPEIAIFLLISTFTVLDTGCFQLKLNYLWNSVEIFTVLKKDFAVKYGIVTKTLNQVRIKTYALIVSENILFLIVRIWVTA